jgi:hypothetical protein
MLRLREVIDDGQCSLRVLEADHVVREIFFLAAGEKRRDFDFRFDQFLAGERWGRRLGRDAFAGDGVAHVELHLRRFGERGEGRGR